MHQNNAGLAPYPPKGEMEKMMQRYLYLQKCNGEITRKVVVERGCQK